MCRSGRRGKSRDVVRRWDGNPLIHLQDLEFPCADLRAAGVVCRDNEIVLLLTVDHLEGHQSIHLARQDKTGGFRVDKTPFIGACRADSGCSLHESHGVLDARVTQLDGVYYIMYVASGAYGFRLGLASTQDFGQVKLHGLVSEPDTKGGALFSERIAGQYTRLERPAEGRSIWISYSDDLIHWGASEVLISPRAGFWDCHRVVQSATQIQCSNTWPA
jgi:predicted GH43/DUF377 family glycosyl hydrolase